MNERDDFVYNGETYNDIDTCPIMVNGTTILFGGNYEPTQVSVLSQFGVTRINTLPFFFRGGRCVIHHGVVFLCFVGNAEDQCRYR